MGLFAGIAMPGFFNCGNYLANRHYPHELRGTVSSIINIFGLLGYMTISIVGGYFYDNISIYSPFAMYDILLASSVFAIVYVKRVFKKKKEEE